jgi:DNA-binding transcriptional ArsR family regulator
MAMNHAPAGAHRHARMSSRDHDEHRHGPLGPGADDLARSARLFHALSDPGRLRILRHLQRGEPGSTEPSPTEPHLTEPHLTEPDLTEHRVVDLTAHLGLAQSTVSAHVACLRDCGLLAVRHEGRSSWYRLARPEDTEALLAAGEALLPAPAEEVD